MTDPLDFSRQLWVGIPVAGGTHTAVVPTLFRFSSSPATASHGCLRPPGDLGRRMDLWPHRQRWWFTGETPGPHQVVNGPGSGGVVAQTDGGDQIDDLAQAGLVQRGPGVVLG